MTFAESVTAITNGPLIDVNNSLVFDSNGTIVYTADPYSGYEVTLATRIFSNADYGNIVHLPALNEETWIQDSIVASTSTESKILWNNEEEMLWNDGENILWE